MNCRHYHRRTLTVGEYVRLYDTAIGGPCPFVAGRWDHAPISMRCLKCGAQVPFGPSDEAPVAVEVRAAELAAEWTPEHGALFDASAREDVGWLIVARDLPFVPTNAEEEAGYLAYAIAHHDDEQAVGQALSDGGTTEGA